MAKLIPSFVDEQTPPGERDVFNLIANGPDDWTALHSLDIAPWNRGLRTEIDFVVIIPDTGILCVEVKSHEEISFEEGRWSPPSIKRSPFKQATSGAFAFLKRLRSLAPQFGKVPVVHTCIFPRASFNVAPNLSVQSWELMDARAFRSFKSGVDLCNALKRNAQSAISIDSNITPLSMTLPKAQIDQIVSLCVPVQRRPANARDEIRQREVEADAALRAQQKPIVGIAEDNERVVVYGGAGTGKTLIAMEVARRAADRGKRVGLLCYNRLVGEWMTNRMRQMKPSAAPNLVVGRATQVLAEMTGVTIPAKPSGDFWDTELPRLLEERLTDPDFKADAVFDYLVLDEAQDVLARGPLWECLQQFLLGGLEKGSYFLCGDFEHQVLAQRSTMEQSLSSLFSISRPTKLRLTENCRNYRIVGDTAVTLSGLTAVYNGYMRPGGSVQNYDIEYYESDDDQAEKLRDLLKGFQAAGYRPSDISILSFRTADASVAARLKDPSLKLHLAQIGRDGTGYSSVHAFKGMENKVVVLTDVVLGEHAFQRDLFYTGMTRATETVRVLCSKASQKTLVSWLSGRNAP